MTGGSGLSSDVNYTTSFTSTSNAANYLSNIGIDSDSLDGAIANNYTINVTSGNFNVTVQNFARANKLASEPLAKDPSGLYLKSATFIEPKLVSPASKELGLK